MDYNYHDIDNNLEQFSVRTRTNDYNPRLIKENNTLNQWKKFLLTKSDEVLKSYKLHFSNFINTSNNAIELLKFINGLLFDRSIGSLGKPPAEYDLRYYDWVILEP